MQKLICTRFAVGLENSLPSACTLKEQVSNMRHTSWLFIPLCLSSTGLVNFSPIGQKTSWGQTKVMEQVVEVKHQIGLKSIVLFYSLEHLAISLR